MNFLLAHRIVFARVLLLIVIVLAGGSAQGATLSAAAVAAFEHDARLVEARLDSELAGKAPFLWIDRLPDVRQRDVRERLGRREIVVERMSSANQASPPTSALVHHWMATVFAEAAPLDRVVRLMQGYNSYQDVYRPAVRRSRLIARDGDAFTVSLQLFAKRVISVVLDTEQRVTYLPVSRSRMQVRSVSTRIAEVEDPGGAGEREAPIGQDSGFLWRFNNYCVLEERVEGPVKATTGGTYIQCESLSLTRDTPFGLGWLIGPFVTSIPRETLEFTLAALRTSLQAGVE